MEAGFSVLRLFFSLSDLFSFNAQCAHREELAPQCSPYIHFLIKDTFLDLVMTNTEQTSGDRVLTGSCTRMFVPSEF